MILELETRVSQDEFAVIAGISQPAVSGLLGRGILVRGGTALQWMRAYARHLEEAAFQRQGEGALDLPQERAALAREQRTGIALKNQLLRQEFAPVAQLESILEIVRESVRERFDELPATVQRLCPELPFEARSLVMDAIANARGVWLRQTAALKDVPKIDPDDDDAPDDSPADM